MLTTIPSAFAQANPMQQFEGQTIDEMIGSFMKEHQIPGMTLAIVQAPYIPRVVGYGSADIEHGFLASPKTLWNVGQITHGFTAVAVMQLSEAGKLSIDDPVGKHVKHLPEAWRSITIRQLIGHSSGLPDYTRQPSFDSTRVYRPEEVIALIKDIAPAFKPGSGVTSGDTDFFLLGLVVEAASGATYEAYVTEQQIKRLGLKNTMFTSDLANLPQEDIAPGGKHAKFKLAGPYINPTEAATGYAEKDGQLVPVARNSQSAWYSNGAVLSSAEDISFWDVGLAGDILLTKASREFVYSAMKLDDGTVVPAHAGWRFPAHKGFMDITGHVPGFSSYLSRFTDPKELVCVTLCANKEGVDLTGLARSIAGAYNSKLGQPVAPKVMKSLESSYPVATTVDRLEEHLKEHGVEVIARIDHAAAAKKKGLELRPTQVLVFGNPAVGTKLMQSGPSVALDLPLRVAVWQEADSTVWVGYDDIAETAGKHGITDQAATVKAMKEALTKALAHATNPY